MSVVVLVSGQTGLGILWKFSAGCFTFLGAIGSRASVESEHRKEVERLRIEDMK